MKRFVHRSLMLTAAACLTAIGGWVSPAVGQGTSGQLPDPISTRDLERYALRLELGEQQKQAVLDIHGDYLQAFRMLREGPIEEFLQNDSGMGIFSLFTNPDEAKLKKSVRDLEGVLNQIATADKRFFDSIQPVLTEDQVVLLQQVRNARERARHRASTTRLTFGTFNPASHVDLARLFDDLDLTPQERTAIMPAVQQYESSMTTASRSFFDHTIRMPIRILQKAQEEGLDVTNMPDTPEGQQAVIRRIGELFMESQTKVAEEMTGLSELNRRTLSQLMDLLPKDAARQLQRDYLRRAYFEIPSNEGAARKHLERALELELDDESRTAVTELRTGYFAQVDTIRRQMMDLLDKRRGTPHNMFAFDEDDLVNRYADSEEKLDASRDQIARINDQTIQMLAPLIGAEPAETIRRHVAESGGDEHQQVSETHAVVMFSSDDGGGGAGTMISLSGAALGGLESHTGLNGDLSDPYLPGPITARELNDYADRLGLSDSDREVTEALHNDYTATYDELRSTQLKAVRDAEQSQWKLDPDSNELTPPKATDIARLFSLRRTALSAILAADATLFDDIQTALLNADDASAFERVQLARQRTVYNRSSVAAAGGNMMMVGGPRTSGSRMSFTMGTPTNEAEIDVCQLIDNLKLDPEQRASIDDDMLTYERSITEAFRQRYDAALKAQEAMDRMMAEQMNVSADGRSTSITVFGTPPSPDDGKGEVSAAQISETIVASNRHLLESVAGRLPEDMARRLRLDYDRKAYPDIYDEKASADPAITQALGLPSLTSAQREQVNDIAIEYRAQYGDVCQRMVEISRDSPANAPFNAGPDQDWQGIQDFRQRLEKLRFERDEVVSKTTAKLRSILRDDQVAAVPALQQQRSRPGPFGH